MRKNVLFITFAIAILCLFNSFGNAQTTVLSENFAGFTVSNGTTDVSSSLNTKTQTPGWTGTKIYENAGNIKLGSSSALGYIVTPTINLSGNGGSATLKLDVMKYSTDSKVVMVYHAPDGINYVQIGSSITPTTAFTTTTINFTGGTASSKIKISASLATSGRFYLDNVIVSQTTTTITVPTLTTTSVSGITASAAVSGGNITLDGGAAVTARGVCWSTSANPTIANSKTTDGTGTGAFTSNLSGLTASTLYHVRAYATNSAGTAYGSDVSFTTLDLPTNSSSSDIIANATFTYSSNINYSAYTTSDVTSSSPEVFKFDIRDGGATADADALATTLTSISFTVNNFALLNKIALYDGTTEIAEVASASSISFSALSPAAIDNGSKSLSLRVTFKTTVTDNLQFSFTVSAATANASGSVFAASNAGGATSSISGDINRIEITASKLVFTTQPSTTATAGIALVQQPVLKSQDVNNNIDLDYSGTVTLSNSGSLTMTGNSASISSGSANFSSFSINQTGNNITLTASSSTLTTATSSSITITSTSNTGTVTVSATSLYNFGNNYSGMQSEAQFFTVSGTGLSNSTTISAPTGFVVSISYKTGYSSTITLTQSGGTLPSTKVYVRFYPFVTGAASGSINITGASAAKTVSVSGTCVASYIPANYYSTATGTGATLKTQLYTKINSHTARSYDNLWTDFQTTDKRVDGKVWDMYSDIPGSTALYYFTFSTNQCGTYSAEGGCYNREHSFPKSWWGGTTAAQYTDLFHLVPTDGYVNGRRSNYALGKVDVPTYTSSNGSKLGPCSYPGYTGTVFEPIDEFKGDFARAYFYMITCYQNLQSGWEANDPSGDAMMDGNTFPGLEPWALDMLLYWHQLDPVSQKEINRNQAIYGIQGNRNPYIDRPDFVDLVWGSTPACTPPTIQSSAFASSAITQTGMNIQWTRGNGNSVLVVARQGSAVNNVPSSGSSFTANAVFGSGTQIGTGNYVIYNGTGTSVSISGLTATTAYYFAIFEYNNTGICYLTPGLTGNATTTAPVTGTPTVSTSAIASFTSTTASCGGNVTADGGAPVSARGVCWNTTTNPTISTSKTSDGTGTGTFTSSITGLTASTTYYVRAYATNANGTSYGSNVSFTTSPSTLTYCTVKGTNYSYEWIDLVQLGTINNVTAANAGYGNFTSLSTNLTKGTQYTINFSTGYSSSVYTEYWKIWIDYNQNGVFTDAGELVATGTSSTAATYSASFTVLSTATSGSTRMRVLMSDNSGTTSSCGTFSYGEVEDYTVNLTAAKSGYIEYERGLELSQDLVEECILYPNPAENQITIDLKCDQSARVEIINITGKSVLIQQLTDIKNELNIAHLPNGVYLVNINDGKKTMKRRFVKN